MPIHWLDWSEESFRRAQGEDKPILLSLTAGWSYPCRLMDDQAWADPQVAEILHKEYVPVRVDADRRPDVNDRYNTSGLPTTAFLTPKGEYLWGATYLPPDEMKQVLVQLKTGFINNRGRLEEEIRRRDEKIAQARQPQHLRPSPLGVEILRKSIRGIVYTFDSNWGGFGREPKFAVPASLEVLLAAYAEAGGPDLLQILLKTLDAVGDGGLRDAAGGGYFRCTLKETWTQPLTEKMAEENAELIRAFLDASIVLGSEKYRKKGEEALDWLLRALCDREKARFFASEAADPPASDRRRTGLVDRTLYSSTTAVVVSALLRASAILGRADLGDLALRALEAVVREGFDASRGMAHYFDGGPRVYGLARDQGLVARALVDAYEFTGRAAWLEPAQALVRYCRERLWSDEEKGLLDRPPGVEEWGELSKRRCNLAENAVVAEAAARLSCHLEPALRDFAHKILSSFPDYMDDYGHHTVEYAMACDFLARPATEIELVGSTPEIRRAAFGSFVPRRVIRHLPSEPGAVARVRRGAAAKTARTIEEFHAILKE